MSEFRAERKLAQLERVPGTTTTHRVDATRSAVDIRDSRGRRVGYVLLPEGERRQLVEDLRALEPAPVLPPDGSWPWAR